MLNIATHQITGLDKSFDQVIRDFPDDLIGAPDAIFLDPEFSRDPYAPLGDLMQRSGGVVRRDTEGLYGGIEVFNVWGHDLSFPHFLALGYEAVKVIGFDAKRFGNDQAYGAQQAAHGATVNCLDGVEHRKHRRIFDTAVFGRKQAEQRIDTLIRPLVSYLVDRVVEKINNGEFVDACRDIGIPAAYKTISTIIGVPQDKFASFVRIGEVAQSGARNLEAAVKAIADLDEFFLIEYEKRVTQPELDMLSALQRSSVDDFKLDKDTIVQHCRFLLPGGIETTWRMTANMVMAMMMHPEQYRAVVEHKTLVNQAVEECLRWAPSGFVVPRRALVDTEVEGVSIPAGSFICSVQGIANRDPAIWNEPEKFDIFRETHPHLTFHVGAHFCMGQLIARGLLREILTQLAQKLPTLKLDCAAQDIETAGFGVRCPEVVPLTI